ncbi:cilia and flagella associated protein 410 [Lamellibrachia satsuma]|nr:cilia and flagella associated protein 410 [Lamellibrachia satsuma]
MNKLSENLVLARSRASDLENVRKLNCWGSSLNDVSILRRMPNIQVVSLSVNEITSLADFVCCINLEELYIRKNNILDLSEICHLRKLPKLRNLWLADNPCATGDLYRLTVLRTLPNLQKLDNVAVQQEEINEALERGLELSLGRNAVPSAVTPPRAVTPTPAQNCASRSPPASPARVKTTELTGILDVTRQVDSDREDGTDEVVGSPITLTWEETKANSPQLSEQTHLSCQSNLTSAVRANSPQLSEQTHLSCQSKLTSAVRVKLTSAVRANSPQLSEQTHLSCQSELTSAVRVNSPQLSERTHLSCQSELTSAIRANSPQLSEQTHLSCQSKLTSAVRANSPQLSDKIRAQLGLRLLPVEKVTPLKPRSFHSAKQRNANILQACLHLVKELDVDSLEIVADAVRNRMESL